MSVLFAFLHHLLAFGIVAALVAEMVILREELTAERVRRLAIFDGVYGAMAGLLLLVGLLRVTYFEKGPDYYFYSVPFLIKFSVFILVGLVSIYPTVKFVRWRKAYKDGGAPAIDPGMARTLRRIVHWELTGIVVILLCAALMARGIGFFG